MKQSIGIQAAPKFSDTNRSKGNEKHHSKVSDVVADVEFADDDDDEFDKLIS
jgi:hypothetical protein